MVRLLWVRKVGHMEKVLLLLLKLLYGYARICRNSMVTLLINVCDAPMEAIFETLTHASLTRSHLHLKARWGMQHLLRRCRASEHCFVVMR